jgi:hypothetical protein
MISLQSCGGWARSLKAVLVCDICGQPIRDIGLGAAVYPDVSHGEGEIHQVLHVTKDDAMTERTPG